MNDQTYTSVKLSKDNNTVIVTVGSKTALFSANLLKHLLDIPYTKKNGTMVSLTDIKALKAKSQAAYAKAVKESSKPVAKTGA